MLIDIQTCFEINFQPRRYESFCTINTYAMLGTTIKSYFQFRILFGSIGNGFNSRWIMDADCLKRREAFHIEELVKSASEESCNLSRNYHFTTKIFEQEKKIQFTLPFIANTDSSQSFDGVKKTGKDFFSSLKLPRHAKFCRENVLIRVQGAI